MDGFASYEGTSGFLRWWPKIMIGIAFAIAVDHGSHWMQFATVFVVCAWLHGRMLPWRFSVLDDGLELEFPFGRHVFLPKPATTVRIETVGAVATVGARRHLGYLLHDGVLYEPGQRIRLQRAFAYYGYHVV